MICLNEQASKDFYSAFKKGFLRFVIFCYLINITQTIKNNTSQIVIKYTIILSFSS